MSSAFLERFVEQVLRSLEANDEIELETGKRSMLVREVAASLGSLGQGHQLVSSLSRALVASPHVVELYVDDEELKQRIGDLDNAWMRGG